MYLGRSTQVGITYWNYILFLESRVQPVKLLFESTQRPDSGHYNILEVNSQTV